MMPIIEAPRLVLARGDRRISIAVADYEDPWLVCSAVLHGDRDFTCSDVKGIELHSDLHSKIPL